MYQTKIIATFTALMMFASLPLTAKETPLEEKVILQIQNQNYDKVAGLLIKEKLSLQKMEKLARSAQSAPLFQAVRMTKSLKKLVPKENTVSLLKTALFIETKLPQNKPHLSQQTTKLPYTIEVDSQSKQPFIVLEGKRNWLGKGKKKVVAKALLYKHRNPQVVARAVQSIPMERELKITKNLQGKAGIFKTHGFVQHKSHGKKYTTVYSKLYRSGSLRTVFDRDARFSLREKIRIAYQISQGLYSLHKRAIVHCDLGARNYLIDIPRGKAGSRAIEATIADLGRAEFTKSMGHPKAQGNMSYAPPEGLKRKELHPKDYFASDVFAVGCVFYELFYGKKPSWHTQSLSKDHSKPVKTQFKKLVGQIKCATAARRSKLKQQRRDSKEQFEYLVLQMVHTDSKRRPTAKKLCREFSKLHKVEKACL